MNAARLTAAEYHAEIAKPAKRNKYGAKRAQAMDGRWFDSIRERDRYEHLRLREMAREISHLECQPRFPLEVNGKPLLSENGRQLEYRADFAYFDGEKRVVEDAKSPATRTRLYQLKRAIVEAMHPAVRIVEV